MSGEVEFGKCQICGKETYMERTYFRYPIKCECHSPQHFELVIHCKNCVPTEPLFTKLTVRTEVLNAMAPSRVRTEVNNNVKALQDQKERERITKILTNHGLPHYWNLATIVDEIIKT